MRDDKYITIMTYRVRPFEAGGLKGDEPIPDDALHIPMDKVILSCVTEAEYLNERTALLWLKRIIST